MILSLFIRTPLWNCFVWVNDFNIILSEDFTSAYLDFVSLGAFTQYATVRFMEIVWLICVCFLFCLYVYVAFPDGTISPPIRALFPVRAEEDEVDNEPVGDEATVDEEDSDDEKVYFSCCVNYLFFSL